MPRFMSFVVTRIASIIFVMWGAATLAFLTLQLTPGDPVTVMLGANTTASPAVREKITKEFGLDQPLVTQYLQFLGKLLRGDLGNSYQIGQPVVKVIQSQIGYTLQLAVSAATLATIIAVIVAVLTSSRRRAIRRSVSSTIELIAASSPSFWVGLMLLALFSYRLKLLPVAGAKDWTSLILPSITMALPIAAILTQVLRRGMEESLRQPYTITARARGLSDVKVLAKHSLRHGTIPAVTLTGFIIGSLLGGAVIAETVFGRPGLGRIALAAISGKDIPVVMGTVLISALAFVTINLIVDLVYLAIDPRLRVA